MGDKIKAFDEEGNEKEIDIDSIKWFGTDVERTYYKNSKFKSFKTHTWIKVNSVKLYPEDWKISNFKKYFDKYESSKRVIKELKDDKEKRATEWSCEVLEEGLITLNKESIKTAEKAVERKRLLNIGKKEFLFIFDKFFRDNTDTNNYYYFDGEKMVDTKYNVRDKVNEPILKEWAVEYEGSSEKNKELKKEYFKEKELKKEDKKYKKEIYS